jgi:hypothetical protein
VRGDCIPPRAPRKKLHAVCDFGAEQKEAFTGRVLGYVACMSIDQIASEALRLPARARALLAGSLWESLEDPFAAPSQMEDAAAAALALERDRQIEQGEVQAVAHEEMMARLR